MQVSFRNILPILILPGFLMYACGLQLFFEFRIREIKHANYKALEHADELVNLQIPVDEVRWIEDHEFLWDGWMYDVAEMKIIEGILYCRAYKDKSETEWLKNYDKRKKESDQQLHSKSLQPFLGQSAFNLYPIPSVQLNALDHTDQDNSILSPDILSPPPEV